MPETPVYGWPYHHLFEPPDGADLGEDLALAIEATVQTILSRLDALLLPVSDRVNTSQTTTSTTYTNLATVGPSVTLDTGTSALVILTCRMRNTGVNLSRMSVDISGASTISAATAPERSVEHEGTGWQRASTAYLQTGLTAGSNTFKAEYRVAAGTGTFEDREITVIPFLPFFF